MTSFIINSHVLRPRPKSWMEDCPFCKIVKEGAPAHRVYEDEQVVAFLDILPLRRGHTLVVPKAHVKHLSDLTSEIASALGAAVAKVAKALNLALDNDGLNVVCNQEYAQAVPHVHYHIIPAPVMGSSSTDLLPTDKTPMSTRKMARLEFEAREELGDDEALVLAKLIRARL